MHYEQHYLKPLLEPASIAIVGASETEGSVGAILARNMLDMDYKGRLFFVNPKHKTVYGHPCHARIEDVPQRLDLAAICTPAHTVPAIVEACGHAGTRSALIVSSGFAETGTQTRGAMLERSIVDIARRHRMRLLGPNCLGIMRPAGGVNLTYTHCSVNPGGIGLISQSGALCTAVLDWAQPNNVGFSSVVSLGTSSDVDFGEVLDYMVADPKTKSIFLYIEGVRNARRFMSALRAAARCKPVLVIKVGRHPAGEQAARSHSGAIVGADDVFDAALRRAGVVRLFTVGQMYATVQALFAHFQPRGNRLAILTNGGGLGVMAADHADDIGIRLADLAPKTLQRLDKALPAGWSRSNPLDIGGEADPARYALALRALQEDENVDGVLTILAPQAQSDPTQTARGLIDLARQSDKPLVTCWMGDAQVREARLLFKGASIPAFRTPEPAVELFSHLSNYFRNQKLLLQTPPASLDGGADAGYPPARSESARLVIETALHEGRLVLSEMESKALLAAFRIPIAQTMLARSVSEALVLAEEIGLPVVMKIDSPQVTEKSSCGGVRLNLTTPVAVRDAYQGIHNDVRRCLPEATINGITIEPMISKPHGRELRIAIVQDPVFGPAITLGPGGADIAGSAAERRCVALPPLDPVLIGDMLQSSRLTNRLVARGMLPNANMQALEAVLLRVSEMACELPWIRELEINPLIIDEHGAVAVDARIVIAQLPQHAGPYDHMAIHPYPAALVSSFEARNGRQVTLRPIKPADAALEQAFVQKLSPQSRYLRFMNAIRELSPAQLVRLTQIDYDREMAFIAVVNDADGGAETQIGVARYAVNPDGASCEFAIVVADDWQGLGLAQRLMAALIETARNHAGLKTMHGDFLIENQRMLAFARRLGFVISAHPDEPGLKRGVLALA
ncbi:Acyl-CoA synthetase [Sterolibacterium denitrificans]|uniref:Acyl-CoA synthetase n=1 Tax=Sterolibacterium denitrificans TaxID=157592 RepID=A0A7Z7HSP6_9PROT|nr:GNAT family N-acetyltransferase [Sterolibacterium denitrificans]SMB27851.1 Acyl-CoA synthetase [Sterolibacterium denitrificans]